jgi:hypothetical protein
MKIKLKNMKAWFNKEFLIDNIRSNSISIVIGILISLFINLFTSVEKNILLWLSITSFVFSFFTLVIALVLRPKIDKKVEEIFNAEENRSLNFDQKWAKVYVNEYFKKHFKNFKLSLVLFLIMLVCGAGLTYFGNKTITNNENSGLNELTSKLDSLVNATKNLENQLMINDKLHQKHIDSLYSKIVDCIDCSKQKPVSKERTISK